MTCLLTFATLRFVDLSHKVEESRFAPEIHWLSGPEMHDRGKEMPG